MAKKTQTAVAIQLQFNSVADIALQHGRADNAIAQCAKEAMSRIAGFPDKDAVSETDMESLRDGYKLAYKEFFVPQTYAVINGHYVIASPEHLSTDNVEKIELTLDYCLSHSKHEMGTLFKDRPQLKELISKVRDTVSTYATNRIKRLMAKAQELIKEQSGVTTTRQTVLFDKAVTKAFDALEKSVKVKEKNGDATANPLRFRMAVEAFWKAYNA